MHEYRCPFCGKTIYYGDDHFPPFCSNCGSALDVRPDQAGCNHSAGASAAPPDPRAQQQQPYPTDQRPYQQPNQQQPYPTDQRPYQQPNQQPPYPIDQRPYQQPNQQQPYPTDQRPYQQPNQQQPYPTDQRPSQPSDQQSASPANYPTPEKKFKLWIPLVCIGAVTTIAVVIIFLVAFGNINRHNDDGSSVIIATEKTETSASSHSSKWSFSFPVSNIEDSSSEASSSSGTSSSSSSSSRPSSSSSSVSRVSSSEEESSFSSQEDESSKGSGMSTHRFTDDSFKLTFPDEWEYDYTGDDSMSIISFYEPYNHSNGGSDGMGWLFSIRVYYEESDYTSFTNWGGSPKAKLIAEHNGKYFVADYPTDVRFTSAGKDDYQAAKELIPDVLDSMTFY